MSPRSISKGASRARRPLALALVVAALASTFAGPARAAGVVPKLAMLAPNDEVTLWRYGRGGPVYMELGVMMAATGAPFELQARRSDYTQPVTLDQVLYGPGGERGFRSLDASLLDDWNGLKDFFGITMVDDTGAEVVSEVTSFCPGGYDRQRLDDSGPNVPLYPSGCYSNPFTKGVVWGIDQGWAVASTDVEAPTLDLPNGRYTATITVGPQYVDLFGIAPEDATAQINIRVRTLRDVGCDERACPVGAMQTRSPGDKQQAQAVPVMDNPDAAFLPDLIALPSWGIYAENRKTRTTLTFGATVWNGGASNMVVEGFRRDDEDIMDGFQYFYDGDEVVGKAPAGELEYDPRQGHEHWHFKQFAAYSLLDANMNEVRVSRKEAFCLAPTDAIDMTLPDADWNPGAIGLYSACGGQNSVWTRETLPVGWGDTYFQGLPGQSFWITNLANGTYYIKVEANPAGLLKEQSAANNVELRQITLTGKPGHRRVEVPPWNGIDTEATFGPGGAGG